MTTKRLSGEKKMKLSKHLKNHYKVPEKLIERAKAELQAMGLKKDKCEYCGQKVGSLEWEFHYQNECSSDGDMTTIQKSNNLTEMWEGKNSSLYRTYQEAVSKDNGEGEKKYQYPKKMYVLYDERARSGDSDDASVLESSDSKPRRNPDHSIWAELTMTEPQSEKKKLPTYGKERLMYELDK